MASVLLVLNLSALFAIAAAPGEVDTPQFIGPCYQTMGYCSGTLTYKCQGSYTSERCRLYVCAPTCTLDPPSYPSE